MLYVQTDFKCVVKCENVYSEVCSFILFIYIQPHQEKMGVGLRFVLNGSNAR